MHLDTWMRSQFIQACYNFVARHFAGALGNDQAFGRIDEVLNRHGGVF